MLMHLFFQAYADYMGFILTLNEGVKGKKLTCEYKVSEVWFVSSTACCVHNDTRFVLLLLFMHLPCLKPISIIDT